MFEQEVHIMKKFFLLVFIISTAIHLAASYKNDKRLRGLTKPFILASLLGFYCFAAAIPQWTVVLALLFSWFGDIFLMLSGTKWFVVGGISFMISHFFFILSYSGLIDFSNLKAIPAAMIIIAFLAIVIIIFSKLKKYLSKALFYPMMLYLFINGMMNAFSMFRAITLPSAAAYITVVGAILFFISDTSLFFVRFNKDSVQKSHFLVMLTYSLGELLIVLGLL